MLEPIAGIAPVLGRLALGVTLLGATWQGVLISPGIERSGSGGFALLAAQLVVGMMLMAGRGAGIAAVATIALVAAGTPVAGPAFLTERMDVVGLAAFVALIGPHSLSPRLQAWELDRVRVAAWALRVGLATGLLVTAFTEKFGTPSITAGVLAAYPQADPSPLLGIDQGTFIVLAGGVEVLFALLVFMLPLPELTVIGIAAPFVLTVGIFGPIEILGHLPIYGAMASLLLLSVHPQGAGVVASLLPTGSALVEPDPAIQLGRLPWAPVPAMSVPAMSVPEMSALEMPASAMPAPVFARRGPWFEPAPSAPALQFTPITWRAQTSAL